MPSMWMDVDTALPEVPVNILALIADSDFKTRQVSVTFDQAGLVLIWNFVTTAGIYDQTAVTPTNTGGDYDWVNQGNGMYTIEIPLSGGASIRNDEEGFGWFSGFATGILPWIGPTIGFRDAALNNLLIDTAMSATRGLAGTALPAAVADAAGGLPISDAGGLALDEIPVAIDRNMDLAQHLRGFHTHQGDTYYVAPVNGDDTTGDGTRALPYKTIQNAIIDLITSGNHDTIIVLADASPGVTTHTSTSTIACNKRYFSILGPGRDLIVTRSNNGPTFTISADGVEISGFQIGSDGAAATSIGISIIAVDFHRIHNCWFLDTQGDGIKCERGSNCKFHDNHFEGTGIVASGNGIHISGAGGVGNADSNSIIDNHFSNTGGTAILIDDGTTDDTEIYDNTIHNAGGWGIDITDSSVAAQVYNNILGNNSSGDIRSADLTAIIRDNREWTTPAVEATSASGALVIRTLDIDGSGHVTLTDGAHGGSSAVLTLSQLVISGSNASGSVDIDNTGGPGIKVDGTSFGLQVIGSAGPGASIISSGGNGSGVVIAGNSSGDGLAITAGATGIAIDVIAASGQGLKISGNDALGAIDIDNSGGAAIKVDGSSGGIVIDGLASPGVTISGTGSGLSVTGFPGPGILVSGTTFGIDVDASAGTGVRIVGTDDDILADITGSLSGSVGNVDGNVSGDIVGDVLGSVVGDVRGSVLLNVDGNVSGSVQGNVDGSVGSVAGAVGSVIADVTTDVASRTASKADVSALATSSALNTHDIKLDTVDSNVDANKVILDALTAAAAAKLALSAGTIVNGVVEAGTLSLTKMSTDLGTAEPTNDHYNGRIIIWTSGLLQNQATDITDYVGTNGVLTFTAVTDVPVAGNTFIIV